MRNIFSNLWYFGSRLFGYGLLFGLIFGSFVYPLIGSMIGIAWGGVAGLGLGLLTGIGVTIYNRFFVKPETDIYAYQRNLTYGVGMATLIITALPLLIVFAPVAALTAAFVAHSYVRRQLPRDEKLKNEYRQTLRTGVVAQMIRRTVSKAPIFVGLVAIGGMFLRWWDMTHSWWNPSTLEIWMQTIAVGAGVVIYGFVLAAVIGLVNGLFVHFLHHLHFSPDTPKDQYKRQVVPMVTVLTLLMTIVAAGFVGAPLAAIAAGWGASKYVDWYYDGQEKPKRDARYGRLSDEINIRREDNFFDESVESEEEEYYLWNEGD